MTPKEWMVFTATKVGLLAAVVLLILATNYSTWDEVKDLRATLMIAAYYLVQTIIGNSVRSRIEAKNTTSEPVE